MAVSWKDDGSFDCPHCGATLRSDAKMCRECGADANCGWNDEDANSEYSAEDDFDYDEYIAREFPGDALPGTAKSQNWIRLILLLVIISMLLTIAL